MKHRCPHKFFSLYSSNLTSSSSSMKFLLAAFLASCIVPALCQLRPYIERIGDISMKACPKASCSPVNVQITVGHQDPSYDIRKLQITEITPSPRYLDPGSPLSSASFVLSDGSQRVIALTSNGKNSGTTRITGEHSCVLPTQIRD